MQKIRDKKGNILPILGRGNFEATPQSRPWRDLRLAMTSFQECARMLVQRDFERRNKSV